MLNWWSSYRKGTRTPCRDLLASTSQSQADGSSQISCYVKVFIFKGFYFILFCGGFLTLYPHVHMLDGLGKLHFV